MTERLRQTMQMPMPRPTNIYTGGLTWRMWSARICWPWKKTPKIGFGKYIISATTPFQQEHLWALRKNVHEVVKSLYSDFETVYEKLDWKMFPLDRPGICKQKSKRGTGMET